jgi:hypothetical protein
MKARLLRKLLNNTEYSISNHEDYIAVGSPLCHNLISVDTKSLKVTYALDTYREGRKSLEEKTNRKGENELLFIWDKLHELIENGQIQDIINGKDEIKNPLPVFTVIRGDVVESVTDKYGWPNTDDNGVCMYEDTHFPTIEQAIEYGISEYKASNKHTMTRIEEVESQLMKLKERASLEAGYIAHLEWLKNKQ